MHENKIFCTFTYLSFFTTCMNCCYQEERTGWKRIQCYDYTGYHNPNLIAHKYPPPGKRNTDSKEDRKESCRTLWIPEKNCVYTDTYLPNQIAEEELLGTITVAMLTHR